MASWPSLPCAPPDHSRLSPRRCKLPKIDGQKATILHLSRTIQPVVPSKRKLREPMHRLKRLPSSSDLKLISASVDQEICSSRLSVLPPFTGRGSSKDSPYLLAPYRMPNPFRPSKPRGSTVRPVKALPAIQHPQTIQVQDLPPNSATIIEAYVQTMPIPKQPTPTGMLDDDQKTVIQKSKANDDLRAGGILYPTFSADCQINEHGDAQPKVSTGMSFTSFSERVVATVAERQLHSTPSLDQLAPFKLEYPDVKPFVVGQWMSLAPTVVGKVEAFTVEPALPDGLNLHSTTGLICGSPTLAVSRTTYTISAQNLAGVVSTTCDITVAAPSSHSTVSPVIYPYPTVRSLTIGDYMELRPKIIGSVDGFSVEPKLPAGLSLDTATGLISGSPVAISDVKTYILTSRSAAGSTMTRLKLSVSAPTCKALSDSTLEPSGTEQTPPQIFSRDAVMPCSTQPMLFEQLDPAGIFLDVNTGMIRWQSYLKKFSLAFLEEDEDGEGSDYDDEQMTVLRIRDDLSESEDSGFEEEDKGSDDEVEKSLEEEGGEDWNNQDHRKKSRQRLGQ
eukprot:gnl/MRDRNA2_/MRDRNA2_167033_c0_seq1.p1 gnl/MRDRNA2_/MRDRNA2_167033_c0~~gnl/MRDRNA2_/MRDRNA2_167033_c0_seq1.p1  ORF type:complete len:561 (-),score=74.06 gnl/MRDRNA2_/MRDRNA2_167033_c0_seq1:18-1700(-)